MEEKMGGITGGQFWLNMYKKENFFIYCMYGEI